MNASLKLPEAGKLYGTNRSTVLGKATSQLEHPETERHVA